MIKKPFESKPKSKSEQAKPAVEVERHPEVLSFEEGVQRIADRALELLRTKSLVTALLYGLPNVGKSTLVDAIMNGIAQRAASKLIFGGEIKGYDEKPDNFDENLPAVYFIDRLTYAVGNPYEKIVATADADEHNFPQPDFIIVIINFNMYDVAPENFVEHADVIISNSASCQKNC